MSAGPFLLALFGGIYGIAEIFNAITKTGSVEHWGAFVGGFVLILVSAAYFFAALEDV